jgi:Sec-independent protein translocase protein TatA
VFNLDPSKLLVIAVVAIIVLGPNRLPHFARQVGSAWRSFSEVRQRMESEVRNSIPQLPSTTELANYARSPSALLDRLASTAPADASAGNGGVDSSLQAKGDLPTIVRGDGAHWAASSPEAPTPIGSPGTDAENGRHPARGSVVGDATLN